MKGADNGLLFPPFDICLGHKEPLYFTNPKNGQECSKIGNAYYHINLECIKKKHPSFTAAQIECPPDVYANLRLRAHELPESQQGITTASRREACVSRKEDDAMVLKLRRDNMIQAHNRLQALQNKEQTEKHKLLKEHLITSSEELYQAMGSIDAKISTTTKRKAKKVITTKSSG